MRLTSDRLNTKESEGSEETEGGVSMAKPKSKPDRGVNAILRTAQKRKVAAESAALVSGVTLKEIAQTVAEISKQLQVLIDLHSKK